LKACIFICECSRDDCVRRDMNGCTPSQQAAYRLINANVRFHASYNPLVPLGLFENTGKNRFECGSVGAREVSFLESGCVHPGRREAACDRGGRGSEALRILFADHDGPPLAPGKFQKETDVPFTGDPFGLGHHCRESLLKIHDEKCHALVAQAVLFDHRTVHVDNLHPGPEFAKKRTRLRL